MKKKEIGIIVLAFVLGMSVISGCGKKTSEKSSSDNSLKKESVQSVAGGVSITYQTKEKNPSAEEMADTVNKLKKRAEIYGEEVKVYQESERRITVEISGVTDIDVVLNELGKPCSLEFVRMTSDGGGETFLDGTDVKDAQAGTQDGQTGEKEYVVKLTLTDDGAQKFGKATAANIGKQIWIMYDEIQISAPVINSAIYDGKFVITGMESLEAAEKLATEIRIGVISLELEELRSNVVDEKTADSKSDREDKSEDEIKEKADDYKDTKSVKNEETLWVDAYKDFLLSFNQNAGNETYKFSLIYIDDDDVPEIMLAAGNSHGDQVDLYTYYNGKVEKLFEQYGIGYYGYFRYVVQGNIMYSEDHHMGSYVKDYYKISHGKAELVAHFQNDIDSFDLETIDLEETPTYEYNGLVVSREQYQNEMKKMDDKYKYAVVAAYDGCMQMTEENIDAQVNEVLESQ